MRLRFYFTNWLNYFILLLLMIWGTLIYQMNFQYWRLILRRKNKKKGEEHNRKSQKEDNKSC